MLTTHYLEEAEALSSRIGIMSDGNLAAVGTAYELMKAAGRDSFEDAFVELCTKGGVYRENAVVCLKKLKGNTEGQAEPGLWNRLSHCAAVAALLDSVEYSSRAVCH